MDKIDILQSSTVRTINATISIVLRNIVIAIDIASAVNMIVTQ